MRSRRWLVTMVIAIGSGAIANAEKTGAFDACALLTRDEIIAALGSQDLGSGERRDGGTECRYSSSNRSLTVWTIGSLPLDSFQEFRDVLKEQHRRIEPAPGIGDDAYIWDDRIYVRVGARGFTLEIHQHLYSTVRAPARPALLTLARSGVSKLR